MSSLTEALEQIDAMRKQDTDHFTFEPLEPGETVPRYYGHGYRAARQTVRDGAPITWPGNATVKLREIAVALNHHPLLFSIDYVDAVRHFDAAANPALSDEARTQHFDIGGRRLWDLLQGGSAPQALWDAFRSWRALGGT